MTSRLYDYSYTISTETINVSLVDLKNLVA